MSAEGVFEINRHTSKLFDLSKIRLKIKVKEHTMILMTLKISNWAWVFTTTVSLVGEHENGQ